MTPLEGPTYDEPYMVDIGAIVVIQDWRGMGLGLEMSGSKIMSARSVDRLGAVAIKGLRKIRP